MPGPSTLVEAELHYPPWPECSTVSSVPHCPYEAPANEPLFANLCQAGRTFLGTAGCCYRAWNQVPERARARVFCPQPACRSRSAIPCSCARVCHPPTRPPIPSAGAGGQCPQSAVFIFCHVRAHYLVSPTASPPASMPCPAPAVSAAAETQDGSGARIFFDSRAAGAQGAGLPVRMMLSDAGRVLDTCVFCFLVLACSAMRAVLVLRARGRWSRVLCVAALNWR
jgi:hypothetical protein